MLHARELGARMDLKNEAKTCINPNEVFGIHSFNDLARSQ
jgi:hypothetical protein